MIMPIIMMIMPSVMSHIMIALLNFKFVELGSESESFRLVRCVHPRPLPPLRLLI